MKRYILNITTLITALILSANFAWGQTTSGDWQTTTINANKEITLNGTVNIKGTITINSNCTLKINGNNNIINVLTTTDAAPILSFDIKAGGKLEINNATLEGGNTGTIAGEVGENDVKSYSGFTKACAVIKVNDNAQVDLTYVTAQNLYSGSYDKNTGTPVFINLYGNTNGASTIAERGIVNLNNCTVKNCLTLNDNSIIYQSGVNAHGTFNIKNTTITNCMVLQRGIGTGYGGVIKGAGSTDCILNMEGSTMSYCWSSGWGGAILWAASGGNSLATFTNCTFHHNYARYLGGAISSEATIALNSCNLSYNVAGYGGGALAAFPFSLDSASEGTSTAIGLTMHNNLIHHNRTLHSTNKSGANVPTNCRAQENSKDQTLTKESEGYFNPRYTILNATDINYPTGGGAIWVLMNKDGWNCQISIENGNQINNNESANVAGGVLLFKQTPYVRTQEGDAGHIKDQETTKYKSDYSTVNGNITGVTEMVLNAEIYENTAASSGGGVAVGASDNDSKTWTYPNVTLNGGLITSNIATNNNGGGIYMPGGNFTVNGGEIIGNKAEKGFGGGVYIERGNFTIAQNKSLSLNGENKANDGGAIYLGDGNINVKGSLIAIDNIANHNGGAIYMEQGNFSVNGDITMNENQARANGGALYLGGGKVNATSGVATIQSNTADVNGGAIYVGSGSVTLQETTISGNTSSGNGGAIYAKGDVTINDEATISTNTATYNGGAIYVEDGNLTTKKVTASGNRAANGGVFFVKGGNVNLGVTVSEQTVTQVAAAEMTSNIVSGNGGAIALENGEFTMHNDSKISSNSAGGYGGALYIKNASATSITCKGGTFSNNTAKAGGAVCADGPITLALAANIEDNTAQVGGGIYMVNGVNMTFGDASQPLGLIRANKAEGTTISGTANGMNAEKPVEKPVSGVGGGIFMADGTGSNITTLKFANPKELGIYNNSASFAGADICANGNNTSITLPKTSEMNLTGFDVPGNMLYWAEDFANEDTKYPGVGRGIRYEDELRAQSPNVKHFSADSSHEVGNYVCLDLGYDLVFVKIKNIGLQLNDDCAVTISYDKVQTDANGDVITDVNGNPTYVLTEYRKILFSGKGTANDNNNSVYDTEIGLPSNDSWKFKVTQWSYKYDGVEFNPGEQKRKNNALATDPDAIYGISKEGIKCNNDDNYYDRLITIKHILKKDGNDNDINISDFNTRVVNKMIPGGSSSN